MQGILEVVPCKGVHNRAPTVQQNLQVPVSFVYSTQCMHGERGSPSQMPLPEYLAMAKRL